MFDDVNDTYLIFLLTAEDTRTQPDGYEVDDARFFTLEELETLPRLQFISRMNIIPALQGNTTVLPFYADPFTPPGKGVLYAAEGIREEHERTMHLIRTGQVSP